MARTKWQRLCDLLWLLTSLMICIAAIRLKLGTPSVPGPGFMMFGTGILLFFFSLVSLVKGTREKKDTEPWAGQYWKRVIIIVISLLGYVLILTRLGYILSTLLLMFFIFFWVAEQRKWMIAIIKAVLSAGITYLVFDKWLACQLPKGIFGF